jgi:hypothetical protein
MGSSLVKALVYKKNEAAEKDLPATQRSGEEDISECEKLYDASGKEATYQSPVGKGESDQSDKGMNDET